MSKILIAGCGALGSGLALALSAQGHQVTGLKRKPPQSSGPVRYIAADIGSAAGLENLDRDFTHAFFILSPDARTEQSYRAVYETGLNNLLDRLPDAHWLMVSSTSVYRQSGGEWIDEDAVAEPDNITSHLIRQAEQRLMTANPANIVVRFSGIYGPGREYLLRQAMQAPAIQKSPPYYTNRIHQQDCIDVLAFLLNRHLAGKALAQCYLATDDDPAPLWDVIDWLSEQLDCPPPTIKQVTDATMNKRCSNARLKALGYQFRYPSYIDGYAELINRKQS
jgi:nucleoside-diphosphate-sugar epimerase